MRVILLQDVPQLGSAGETKDVSDGYGRNYLLRRGLAELASEGGLRRAEERKKMLEQREKAQHAEMEKLARKLNGKLLTIKAKVGEQGRLYGSVTTADIAEEIHRSTGEEIDKRKIDLDSPIHQSGEYEVNIKLASDLSTVVRIEVVPDEADVKLEEAAEDKPKAKKKPRSKSTEKLDETGDEALESKSEAIADTGTEDVVEKAS